MAPVWVRTPLRSLYSPWERSGWQRGMQWDQPNRPGQPGQSEAETQRWQGAFGPGRNVWRPAAGYGRLFGGVLIALIGATGLLALALLINSDGAIRVLWLLFLLAALVGMGGIGYLLRGLATMRYVLTEDHLRIEWLRETRRIPYDDMLEVIYHLRDRVALPGRERFWTGFYVSTVQTAGGVWRSYATVPPHRRVRITTSAAVIAISPERPVLFIQELERRRRRTPAGLAAAPDAPQVSSVPVRPRLPRAATARRARTLPFQQSIDLFRRDLLADRIASTLVAVGVIVPVFLLAYTFNEVDFLPDRIPLHWNAHGAADRFGDPSSIWVLPLMALTILVVNTGLATIVLRFDRVAARLLVAITPVVQISAGIALLRIIN